MVRTWTIESTDHRSQMSEHEDGLWVSLFDYHALEAELAASQRVASMMTGAAGKHAEDVVALRARCERLEGALRDAADFIGRWSAVFNAQKRSVLTNEYRAAERAARAALETGEKHG